MYLRLTYLWVNNYYILVYKEENYASNEKLPCLCIEEKRLCPENSSYYCTGKQHPW